MPLIKPSLFFYFLVNNDSSSALLHLVLYPFIRVACTFPLAKFDVCLSHYLPLSATVSIFSSLPPLRNIFPSFVQYVSEVFKANCWLSQLFISTPSPVQEGNLPLHSLVEILS